MVLGCFVGLVLCTLSRSTQYSFMLSAFLLVSSRTVCCQMDPNPKKLESSWKCGKKYLSFNRCVGKNCPAYLVPEQVAKCVNINR